MEWIDIHKIVIALEEHYPDHDIVNIRFTDLQRLVLSLEEFQDEPGRCNEKILEAIQAAWLEERLEN